MSALLFRVICSLLLPSVICVHILRSTTQVGESPSLELLKTCRGYRKSQLTWPTTGNSHAFICQITRQRTMCMSSAWISSGLVAYRKKTKTKHKRPFLTVGSTSSCSSLNNVFSRPSNTSLTHFICTRLEVSFSLRFLQNVKFTSLKHITHDNEELHLIKW